MRARKTGIMIGRMAKPWSPRPKRAERRAFNKRAWADLTRLRDEEFKLRGEPPPPPPPAPPGWSPLMDALRSQPAPPPDDEDEPEPDPAD
jgi:hypothetical protein